MNFRINYIEMIIKMIKTAGILCYWHTIVHSSMHWSKAKLELGVLNTLAIGTMLKLRHKINNGINLIFMFPIVDALISFN